MKFGLNETEIDEIKILYYLFPEIDKIIIFGSRARGDFRKTSDIDIALKGEVSDILYLIKDYFDESSIIYTVDIIDYSKISDSIFKEDIDNEGIEIFV
ncbi:MAG: nucleotidyltransferase family protein [Fusobacteriaceae bacterium]|uniref:nucleotidyltransferase family protein n=1 Tax=Cetobacterium sp. TaxID=2071632 RepID=UPI003F2B3626